jgi:hypothetical protein
MPRPTDRSEILARLRKVISDGGIIVGAGAGMFSRACYDDDETSYSKIK